jgi:Zn-dependent protease
MEHFDLIRTLKWLPGIIIGLTIHEFSHAYVAHGCGDMTSRDQGRVTLNPLKHIDLLGFIMLLFAGFGWAKPVEFNEKNLRNPERDIMKIAVSGPLSNALLAIALSWIMVLVIKIYPVLYNSLLTEVFLYAIYINWGLFIFNLIPLPPLDGSHLLFNYFRKYPSFYAGLYKFGSFLLLVLVIGTVATNINLLPVWPVVEYLGNGFLAMLGFGI